MTSITSTKEPNRTQTPLLSGDFRRFFDKSDSLTAETSKFFKVSGDRFSDWKWQMTNRVDSSSNLLDLIKLLPEEKEALTSDPRKLSQYPMQISPYYFGLILQLSKKSSEASIPIRLQVIPRSSETISYEYLSADPLKEEGNSPFPGLVHLYPDRVALCISGECPTYCRHCFRRTRFSETGICFDGPLVQRAVEYIKKHPLIRDVLVTGGDPFLALDGDLENMLFELRSIPHLDIIRFGTRTPVTLPYRITPELAELLARYHPIWVNTQFNCVEEITNEAVQAISNLVMAGIPVGNQSVLLKGVNDKEDQMRSLLQKLIAIRVRPYYLFHPHLVSGTQHLRTSIDQGLKIIQSLRGTLSGFAIPTYVVDTPTGKIPIYPDYNTVRDGSDLLMTDLRGNLWREKMAFFK